MSFLSFIKRKFCYTYSFEWLLYFIIEVSLIVFFVVSCYNLDQFVRLHKKDTNIRNGLNIAVECTLVLVGLYLFFVSNKKIESDGFVKLSQLQVCFFSHIAPFLVVTGITSMVTTSKIIENSNP